MERIYLVSENGQKIPTDITEDELGYLNNDFEFFNLISNCKVNSLKDFDFIDLSEKSKLIDSWVSKIQGGSMFRSKLNMAIFVSNVKNKVIRAITLLDYYSVGLYKNKGYTYLIEGTHKGKKLYKIGKANDLNERMKRFEVKIPFDITPFTSFWVSKPLELESILHKQFSSKRVSGEWFDLDVNDIKKLLSIGNSYEVSDHELLKEDIEKEQRIKNYRNDKEHILYLESLLAFNNIKFDIRT